MIHDRRTFMAASAGIVIGANTTLGEVQNSKRRMLFNWDGSMIHCFGKVALGSQKEPLNREQFADLMFGPIDNTPVDTVCFSFGNGNVAEYQSDILEWPGEADGFVFPDSRTWHSGIEVDPSDQYSNPKALAESGNTPPQIVVEECHRRNIRAFVSLRMNDCHDGQHPRGLIPNPELATFKRQHPEWLVEDLDWWTALDYSHPRVRKHRLDIIDEFFEKWDFDGIELDWLRHTLNFPRGTEQKNSHFLTEFLTEVRLLLSEHAKRRGRAIELIVRIPEHVAWCLEGGFHVNEWIQKDLVDGLVLGHSLTHVSHLDGFRKLSQKRKVPLFTCLTPYGDGYSVAPDSVIRGSAANHWSAGSDGLYLFNWFLYGDWRQSLLQEIASPDRIDGLEKQFVLMHRVEAPSGDPGADYVRYNSQAREAVLPLNLSPVAGSNHIDTFITHRSIENSRRYASTELWLAFDFPGSEDDIEIILNGTSLVRTGIIHNLVTLGGHLDPGPEGGILGISDRAMYDTRFKGLRIAVPESKLIHGKNRLTFILHHRTADEDRDLRISRVELTTVPIS